MTGYNTPILANPAIKGSGNSLINFDRYNAFRWARLGGSIYLLSSRLAKMAARLLFPFYR